MQFHFHANQSHFHKSGFALRLALEQRHKGTRKWPIVTSIETPKNPKGAILKPWIYTVIYDLYI